MPTSIKNVGVLVNDIIDVITELKNKYEQQRIILLLEGFSCGLINLLLKQKPLIEKVVFVNPITNWHRVSEVQQINSKRSWFFIENKHYFILRSLVIKYGKDNVINIVNNIVINNVKENE